MLKNTVLVAALAAGFAGVAHADATIYGLLDGGVVYNYASQTIGNQAATATSGFNLGVNQTAGSRLGLKGSEDLGNGLKAVYQLEGGVNLTGDSKLFGRVATLGLSGESFGTLTAGRQLNAVATIVSDFGGFGWSNADSGRSLVYTGQRGLSVKYVSPNFSGVVFAVNGSYGYSKAGETGTHTYGVDLGAKYAADGIEAGVAYLYAPGKHVVTAGAAYDFGVVKVSGAYTYGVNPDVSDLGVVAKSGENNATVHNGLVDGSATVSHGWVLNLTAPVAEAGEASVSYSGVYLKDKDTAKNTDNSRVVAHTFALGYEHKLAKRTSAYASVSYGFGGLKVQEDTPSKATKVKVAQAIVGLKHRF